ncbi:NAD(P)/FAD-dependent oxidoreductase [Paenibacillus sp. NPDC058071]|uniref:NAD(P)/FAD-dependent oxidoreductase n=1 Tax=Paenibacillus sp. NPDC058071 TaxID=3346326 RepID=UPI0036DB6742
MSYDCVIIGGGPAGLNAALVLGRARKKVAIIDNSRPRNGVTHASHGFITRDGIEPSEFRRIAYEEVLRYPTVQHLNVEATDIQKTENGFTVHTASEELLTTRKLILAAGLKETLPAIDGVHEFYGKSLFNCPFCDGWELRDQPLAIISDHPYVFHKIKLLINWTRDLVICTNGSGVISEEQRQEASSKGISIIDTPIQSLSGSDGILERIYFTDGTHLDRSGGFVDPVLTPNIHFAEALGYETSENGAIVSDAMGRTAAAGVFAAGDSAYVIPSQLIYAAASGSKAAMSVVAELIEEDWKDA